MLRSRSRVRVFTAALGLALSGSTLRSGLRSGSKGTAAAATPLLFQLSLEAPSTNSCLIYDAIYFPIADWLISSRVFFLSSRPGTFVWQFLRLKKIVPTPNGTGSFEIALGDGGERKSPRPRQKGCAQSHPKHRILRGHVSPQSGRSLVPQEFSF